MTTKLSEQSYPEGIVPHSTWDFQDSSKISTFQHCPRKYFFRYVLGLGSSEPNHNLEFGQAWHDAMEVLLLLYQENGRKYSPEMADKAIEMFEKHYRKFFDETTDLDTPKNPGRARLALLEYMEQYERDDFEVLGTEEYFKIHLSDEHVLVGKLDAPIRVANGVKVLEHKTTSWAAHSWAEQWTNKIQINNYSLIGFVLFPDFKGMIINGAKFYPKNNSFERVYINKGPQALEDALVTVNYWMDIIRMNFELMAKTKSSEVVMKAFPRCGESCVMFNAACQYKHMCDTCYNPVADVALLQRNFDTVWWNPLLDHDMVKELNLG